MYILIKASDDSIAYRLFDNFNKALEYMYNDMLKYQHVPIGIRNIDCLAKDEFKFVKMHSSAAAQLLTPTTHVAWNLENIILNKYAIVVFKNNNIKIKEFHTIDQMMKSYRTIKNNNAIIIDLKAKRGANI